MGVRTYLLAIMSIAAFACASSVPAAVQYRVTDLGLPGVEFSDISDAGQIVGWTYVGSAGNRAHVWNRHVGWTDLGTFNGDSSRACAVNDSGQIVIVVWDSESPWMRTLIIDASGRTTDIGTLGGPRTYGYDINSRGDVVGESTDAEWEDRAFLWTRQQGMIRIGDLGGGRSVAYAINDAGQIVGSVSPNWRARAVMWSSSFDITDLGTLDGGLQSEAYDINESGTVLGWSELDRYKFDYAHFVWHNGLMAAVVSGFRAHDINNGGELAGYMRIAGKETACIEHSDGSVVDLNEISACPAGCHLRSASRINNRGWVVGDGLRADLSHFSFLLRPIVHVQIDIMPGSDTNPINMHSNGKTPVAILGSAEFDPSGVDIATVTLAGAPVAQIGRRYHAGRCDVNGDGIVDLLIHVNTRQMNLKSGDTTARLEGEMKDGTPIAGEDAVRIVSRRG